MRQKSAESRSNLYEFADWICTDEQRLQRYDETMMHWVGDPSPSARQAGRHPWVKRVRDNNEYVYSLPNMAAFSVARQSLAAVLKDPWHDDNNPKAWFYAEHNLATGEVYEPRILRSYVEDSVARKLWLQLGDESDYSNWPPGRHPSLHQPPYAQRRIEGYLSSDYRLQQGAEYRDGLDGGFAFEDIVVLDSMIGVVRQARGLLTAQRTQNTNHGLSIRLAA